MNSRPLKTPAVTPFILVSIILISLPAIVTAILNDKPFVAGVVSWLKQSVVDMTYGDVVLIGCSWVILTSIAISVVIHRSK